MTIHLDRTVTGNFTEAIKREWLETNGIGGWASSTITNAHTRRYHGCWWRLPAHRSARSRKSSMAMPLTQLADA